MRLSSEEPIRANRLAGLFAPAVCDIFAGCGGWSIGAERAFVRGGYCDKYIDLMINHWETAVGVHQANHPLTLHLHADIREVDPSSVLLGRRLAYLHGSPDCTDHSKAKGDRPKRKEIRALADVMITWAEKRRPWVITLENVEEFQQWGPLIQKRGGRGLWLWTKITPGKGRAKEKRETIVGPKYGTRKGSRFIEGFVGTASSVEPHLIADKDRRGKEFERWVGELEALGYVVDWCELRACDYGAPTTRKRLYVIARCDGKPIIWPEKTHGPNRVQDVCEGRQEIAPVRDLRAGSDGTKAGYRRRRVLSGNRSQVATLKNYRTAAECIDWHEPMLSIFATRAQARKWSEANNVGREKHNRLGVPQRPLKINTQRRLAGGLWKQVLTHAEPFIVNIQNSKWGPDRFHVDRPLPTVTANPKGGAFAAADVELAAFSSTLNHGGDECRSADPREPVNTLTAARDARAVVGAEVAPFTIPRYSEGDGQEPRSRSIREPSPTVTPDANGAQLSAIALSKHYTGVIGQDARDPIGSITGIDHHSALVVHLTQYHTEKGDETRGQAASEPIKTLDTQNRFGAVAAHLVKFRGDSVGTPANRPMHTITSGAGATRDAGAAHATGIAVYYLSHMYTSNTCGGQADPRKPAKTITSGGQHGAVAAIFLSPYYGNTKEGVLPSNLMPTVVGRDRFGLAAVETRGHWILTLPQLRRAKQVATWARKMLGKKLDPYLLSVRDENGKTFKLLTCAVKGMLHLVTDVLMRMLRPRELARAQGFDDSYIIDRMADGTRISRADQVKLIGNSVCPDVAEAIVRENVVKLGVLNEEPVFAGEAVSA